MYRINLTENHCYHVYTGNPKDCLLTRYGILSPDSLKPFVDNGAAAFKLDGAPKYFPTPIGCGVENIPTTSPTTFIPYCWQSKCKKALRNIRVDGYCFTAQAHTQDLSNMLPPGQVIREAKPRR